MLLSLKWLQKFVPELQINNLDDFRHVVDTRLSEVERIEARGAGLQKLVIAKIVSFEAHPKHAHLKVCQVDVGQPELLQIVCGADNVAAGLWSVAVLPGGKVFAADGSLMDIGVRAMAGVDSNGMLCAPDELGLNDDHRGIIEIDHSISLGTDVTDLFSDIVIEIENKALPHRPDAFSHLGIARELAAMFDLELVTPQPIFPPLGHVEDVKSITIDNKVSDSVARYSGVILSEIKVGPSALWLQIALAYTGERAINNIVDITNYVMHHVGQPLHAFDLDKLSGDKVIVRRAKAGEEIVALDGQKYTLQEEMVVIADQENPIAIGGIMGGEHTGVDTNTTNIFLESGNFEMYNIRRTSRTLGLRSEASTRFEKGLSPELTSLGIKQAVDMITHGGLGTPVTEIMESYPVPAMAKQIQFDLSKVRKLSGADIPKQDIARNLRSLGFVVNGLEKYASDISRSDIGQIVEVEVPFWRRDINLDVDLVEEIVRLYGYENVASTLPKRELTVPEQNKQRNHVYQIKQLLADSGMYEVFSYSMVGKELWEQSLLNPTELLSIVNPISPELALVRNNLLPSLMEKVTVNLPRYEKFGLFEIGRVANKEIDAGIDLPQQPFLCAAVRVGEDAETTYRELKYSFDMLNKHLWHSQLQITKPTKEQLPVNMHPGMTGMIVIAKTLDIVGYIGVVHPQVRENMRIQPQVAAWQLNLTEMFKHPAIWTGGNFSNLNNLPTVHRDISFWQQEQTYLQDTLQAIAGLLGENLFSQEVIDIFTDKNKRSITIRLKLQSAAQTLNSKEIDAMIKQVNQIITDHGHRLR